MDLGRAPVDACIDGIGEGDCEPLMKGFRRIDEPLSVLVVILKTRGLNFQNAALLSKHHWVMFRRSGRKSMGSQVL